MRNLMSMVRRRRSTSLPLSFLQLEDRTVPALLTVTNGNDTGSGSLRAAIATANANSEADTVTFAPDVTTVTLTSAELSLTKADLVTIDGGSGVTIGRNGATEFRILNVAANAKADLRGLTLTNGYANGSGAAGNGGGLLVNTGATVTLTNATLSQNIANDRGGGIFNTGTLTLTNATLSGNSAVNRAGGVYNTGTVTLTNATLSGNNANGFGGGIFNSSSGTVTLTNATLTANRTDADGNGSGTGGGIFINGGTVRAFNTIVAGNFVGVGTTANDVNTTFDAASKNNIISGDAKLGPLANNGGPTQTHALLAGSPALNAGDKTLAGVPATDQRGLARVDGSNVDIGAFELSQFSGALVVDTGLDSLDGDYSAGNLSLREAVLIANDMAGSQTITFAPAVATATLTLGELLLTDSASTTIDGGSGVTITRGGATEFRILNVAANAKADLLGLMLTNGKTTSSGGGILIARGATVTLTNSTLSGNTAIGSGGGIYNFGTVTLTNSTLSGNIANGRGGGIFNGGTVTLTNSTLSGNSANGGGGGILSTNAGTMTLTNSTLSGNSANGSGGGIYSINSTVTLTNSTLSGNSANGSAGGILNNGTMTLTNSTLSGNSASNGGGGINNYATLTLTNATVTANRADADGNASGSGGGIRIVSGTVTLFNTIVAGNFKGTGTTADEVNGTLAAASKNNIISGDAKLGPLANNGGFTQTHALLAGSPALNAGDKTLAGVPATDQRGLARVAGSNVDIGAFELSQFSGALVVDTGLDALDGDYSAGKLSLREAVLIANDMAGSQTITFAPTVTTATLTLGELPLTDSASTTINGGNGVTITRGGATEFRILNVAANAKADLLGLMLTNGKSTGNGGGIVNFGTVTLTNSTLSGNTANGSGGGIFNGGTVTVTNTTLSGNTANVDGGGIFNFGMVTLTNATVTANRAKFDDSTSGKGGGIRNVNTVTLSNTIVAGNFNGTGTTADDVSGSVVTASANNLIGDAATAGGLTNGPNGNIVGVDAKLSPLVDAGGGFFVHFLNGGSPAINAGNAADTSTDVFGVAPVVRKDIGAVEFTPKVAENQFSVGSDRGTQANVTLRDQDNTPRYTLTPFGANFTGGIRTASGDVTGDGVADLIVASGFGMKGTVKVFDGVTKAPIPLPETVAGGGTPFGDTFTKGIIVAAGDLNADGLSDLVITAEAGGGARVRVFQSTGTGFVQRSDFIALIDGLGIADATRFRGGSRATVSDINGDGVGDLIWAAGAGGGPRIATFDGTKINNGSNFNAFKMTGDFFALGDTSLRDGCFLAGGDINGDGFGDIVFGGGSGAPPIVVAQSGKDLVANIAASKGSAAVLQSKAFFNTTFGTNSKQGLRVAVKDLDFDNIADVVLGSAPGAGSRVAAFNGKNLSGSNTGTAIFDFDAFAGFTGGVFVG